MLREGRRGDAESSSRTIGRARVNTARAYQNPYRPKVGLPAVALAERACRGVRNSSRRYNRDCTPVRALPEEAALNKTTAPVRPMGLFARIVGVMTSPRATFENIVAAPRPAGVLLVIAIVIGLGAMMIPQLLNEELFQTQVNTQVEVHASRSSGKQHDAGRATKQVGDAGSRTASISRRSPCSSALPIMTLIFAGDLLGRLQRRSSAARRPSSRCSQSSRIRR